MKKSIQTHSQTPLPKKQLAILSAINFSDPFATYIILPFIYDMVKDLNVAEDPKEIGFYVGILISSFSVAGVIGGLFWGWISDRIGRKPVLLIGLLSNSIFLTLFGLSQSFSWAVAVRFLCGLFFANIGVAKSTLSDLTDETNEGQGFSIFGLSFGLGIMVGPVIGGLLCNPTTSLPAIFGGIQFFSDYPYSLPCFIGSLMSMAGFILGFFYFEETLTKKKSNANEKSLEGAEKKKQSELNVQKGWKEYLPIIISIAPYITVCLIMIVFDKVYIFWTILKPEQGGLGFTSKEIGYAMTYQGTMELILQLALYSPLHRRYGNLPCYRLGALVFIIIFLGLPNISFFARKAELEELSWGWMWTFLLFSQTLVAFAGVFAYTTSMLFISSAGRHLNALGTVNGFAQCGAALVRAIGPAATGAVWSWSLMNGKGFPFDFHFLFIFLITLGLFAILQTIIFSKHLLFFKSQSIKQPY